jgi:hypothetical protein
VLCPPRMNAEAASDRVPSEAITILSLVGWLANEVDNGKGVHLMAVQVNEPAPDFILSAVVGKTFRKVKLSDYRGKWVVLFFYPLDFTPV